MVNWFKKKEQIYICPQCGSTNLEFYDTLNNFVEVIRDSKAPAFLQSVRCIDCGYVQNAQDCTVSKEDFKMSFVRG